MPEHHIVLSASFLVDGWTCECSCGWISDAYDESDTALFYGREHQREAARAE